MIRRRTRAGCRQKFKFTLGPVHQHADQRYRCQLRIRIDFDVLTQDHMLRLLNHHTIDLHPTALNVKLGIAARAALEVGHAFGEAHGSDIAIGTFNTY